MKKWMAKSLIKVATLFDPSKIVLMESIEGLKRELHFTLKVLLEVQVLLIEYERTKDHISNLTQAEKNAANYEHANFIQDSLQWVRDEEAKYNQYKAEITNIHTKITSSFGELAKFHLELKQLKASVLADIRQQKKDFPTPQSPNKQKPQ